MRQIKYALAWLFGAFYVIAAWCAIYVFSLPKEEIPGIAFVAVILSVLLLLFGSLGIVIAIVGFFTNNWNKE